MEASGAGCWSTGAIASIGDPRKAALTALLPALSAAPAAGAEAGVFVHPGKSAGTEYALPLWRLLWRWRAAAGRYSMGFRTGRARLLLETRPRRTGTDKEISPSCIAQHTRREKGHLLSLGSRPALVAFRGGVRSGC